MPAAKEEYLDETTTNGTITTSPSRLYTVDNVPSLKAFEAFCSQSVRESTYQLASKFASNIPIYDLSLHSVADAQRVSALQDEWNHILLSGPGVVVLRNFYQDTDLIDRVSNVFSSIVASETADTQAKKGDHFAASGLNSRIWNSFQKHAVADPASFAAYYSNRWLQVACEAWLGPAYQVTAQVNIVHPGGKPQIAHRDYHLGFQTAAACARFPRAVQVASQLLTLQGAVAHSDMPLASGPTRFLPFSQQFEPGYMAYRLPQFTAYFDAHWVSAPLAKGDAVFFNPALVHAAGQNDTADVMRAANLLQVSSAFGRAMEHVDSLRVIDAVWDDLVARCHRRRAADADGEIVIDPSLAALLAAVAEAYPFPTNLDRRPPAPGGMAPESQLDLLTRTLVERWDKPRAMQELRALRDDGLG